MQTHFVYILNIRAGGGRHPPIYVPSAEGLFPAGSVLEVSQGPTRHHPEQILFAEGKYIGECLPPSDVPGNVQCWK